MKTNLFEIAKYCADNQRQKHNSHINFYNNTLFCAISEDNEIKLSYTPHILLDAYKAILIHSWRELAVTNYYSHFAVETIMPDGIVLDSRLDENFKLYTCRHGSYSDIYLNLYFNNTCIYDESIPVETALPHIWEVYKKCKIASNQKEAEMIGELYKKNIIIDELTSKNLLLKYEEKILRKEIEGYKEILDELKKIKKRKK